MLPLFTYLEQNFDSEVKHGGVGKVLRYTQYCRQLSCLNEMILGRYYHC